MSETGRKMDVEDVLSSIRRLVSEEARTASDAETAGENTDQTDPSLLQQSNDMERDKLVLTPSLRVPETEEPSSAAAELEQRIADIESLVMSEAVEDAQSSVAQNVDVQDIEDIPSDAGQESAFFAEMVEDVAQDESEDVSTDATSEMMSALHLSMKDFARAEPPLTANLSAAPSVDDTVDAAEDVVEAEVEATLDAVAEDISFPSDSPFEADLDDVPPEPEFMKAVQAVDAVEASLEDEIEADDTEVEAEDIVRDTIVNREPPLRAPEPEPEPTPSMGTAAYEEPLDYTEDDTFLDEETLREMVSDMVRSELQGELGDRITRNVRKLVRREIHRALASRDFE